MGKAPASGKRKASAAPRSKVRPHHICPGIAPSRVGHRACHVFAGCCCRAEEEQDVGRRVLDPQCDDLHAAQVPAAPGRRSREGRQACEGALLSCTIVSPIGTLAMF